MTWSLHQLFAALHADVEHRLRAIRESIDHPTSKGDASEQVWLSLLNEYLPRRYCAERAFVVDSDGAFSEQIDVLIFDRHYTPLMFKYAGQTVVPAESVYAVFEAKQAISLRWIREAQNKVASVRRLRRTSLPVPYVDGTYGAKKLPRILGGILTLASDWSPALGEPLRGALVVEDPHSRLDIGCSAEHGFFVTDETGTSFLIDGHHATAFLFRLISMLQGLATVPMIDIQAYTRWLNKPS